jgi:hypothetical protein
MSKPEKVTLYWPKGACFWQPRRKYAEGCLLEGQRHGKWVFWYRSGRKQLEGEYAKGKKTDLWIKWGEEGVKITEGNFLYDKMHGRWKDWYGTGQKALESQWNMGKRDGAWTYWGTDGVLTRTERYDHRNEEDKAYSVHTDLEEKEIIRQAQRRNIQRNWERLVGRSVANLVKPWHVACWILLFIPFFSLMKAGRPWRAALVAGFLALLITSVLAWSLERRGQG